MPDPFVLTYVAGVTPSKWVGVWKDRMPLVPIEMHLESPTDALTALREGAADVALLRLPFDRAELSVIPLYWEQPVAVIPKDHVLESLDTITREDLADEIILDGQNAGTVDLVAANLGIALMPQSIARAHSRRDTVTRIITDGVETRIALAWLDGNPDPLIEEFVGIVRGRTANSSRGAVDETPAPTPARKKLPPKPTGKPKPRQTRFKRR